MKHAYVCRGQPISVTLLYRSPVKVFYSSKREAEADNYHDFSQTNRYGQVHAFGGIRGDAKALYRDVVHGRESRIRMCQVKAGGSKSLIAHCFDEADVILWATGYKSRTLPIYDTDKSEIRLRQSQGQVTVDANGSILRAQGTANLVIAGLYGSGHGYGLPAIYENGELDGSKGRADGVAVYMRQAATVILSQVMGDKFPATPTAVAPSPESPASKRQCLGDDQKRIVEATPEPSSKKRRGSVEIIPGGDVTRALFARYPDANVYATRSRSSTPGTVEARDIEGNRIVVALFAQRKPGKPWAKNDSQSLRLEWFESCLEQLGRLMQSRGADTVALPYLIGCGLAGGDWGLYERAIRGFADRSRVHVRLYDIEKKASER
ncbi:hypothetical protein CTAYLR_006122 [Chrysophaeum taylorii]|uniref:Macro domain-containing protein n=1 Tax=Chrysophaeum taylorii TaxID=2483200 RepID=A0AAD7UAC4_9STRA|nr:hypothetical protein CTAYLR_006122 [Chrysophaeum taylorii]